MVAFMTLSAWLKTYVVVFLEVTGYKTSVTLKLVATCSVSLLISPFTNKRKSERLSKPMTPKNQS